MPLDFAKKIRYIAVIDNVIGNTTRLLGGYQNEQKVCYPDPHSAQRPIQFERRRANSKSLISIYPMKCFFPGEMRTSHIPYPGRHEPKWNFNTESLSTSADSVYTVPIQMN